MKIGPSLRIDMRDAERTTEGSSLVRFSWMRRTIDPNGVSAVVAAARRAIWAIKGKQLSRMADKVVPSAN